MEHLRQRHGLIGRLLLGDFKNPPLAAVQHGGRRIAGFVAVLQCGRAGADQAAQHRLFLDDGRVIFGMGGGGHRVGQLHDVIRASHLVEEVLGLQRGPQDHAVDGPVGFKEFRDDAEDELVFFLEEQVALLEEHAHRADDSGVDDHRAQHRGLGGEIVRGHAVDEVGVGLGAGECGTDAGAGGGRQGGHGGIQSMEKGAL